MKSTLESQIDLVYLTISARIKAQQFSQNQSNAQKAEQVYKNTLAISAVNTYLNYSGWITSLITSNSWNPIMQSLMNVADLDVPDYGKVECCWVDSQAKFLVISPEVRENRIAYIAVSLQPSLESAKLLGFIPKFAEDKISLDQLKPILELPAYLQDWKQAQESQQEAGAKIGKKLETPLNSLRPKGQGQKFADFPVAKLKQWLKGLFGEEWKALDTIFVPNPNLSFRNTKQLARQNIIATDTLDEGISRVKLLNLASGEEDNAVALIVCLKERSRDLDISVIICPTNQNFYLPQGLAIFLLDRQQEIVMQAEAEQTKNIEFRFSGEPGECFSIKVCLGKQSQVETFSL